METASRLPGLRYQYCLYSPVASVSRITANAYRFKSEVLFSPAPDAGHVARSTAHPRVMSARVNSFIT